MQDRGCSRFRRLSIVPSAPSFPETQRQRKACRNILRPSPFERFSEPTSFTPDGLLAELGQVFSQSRKEVLLDTEDKQALKSITSISLRSYE